MPGISNRNTRHVQVAGSVWKLHPHTEPPLPTITFCLINSYYYLIFIYITGIPPITQTDDDQLTPARLFPKEPSN